MNLTWQQTFLVNASWSFIWCLARDD